MIVCGWTDSGMCRTENQDAYAASTLCRGKGNERVLAVVCDGMGGAHGGEIASQLATATFVESAAEKEKEKNEVLLRYAVARANTAVFRRAASDAKLSGMGTTLVSVLADEKGGSIAHVGDSRAYLWHNGEIRLLTRDHSYVQQLVDEGQITPEEARHHSRKNLITRAIGVAEKTEADITPFSWSPGDRILLCSDGLSNDIEPGELAAILSENEKADIAVRELIGAANCKGGEDNITALLLENKKGDKTGC